MSACEHCRNELPEDQRVCADAKACAKRVAKLLNARLARMATRPYIGNFSPEIAYRQAKKLGDAA